MKPSTKSDCSSAIFSCKQGGKDDTRTRQGSDIHQHYDDPLVSTVNVERAEENCTQWSRTTSETKNM